jgi:hypothetical protein
MKKILIFLSLAMVMASCVTQKRCFEKYPCASGADTIIKDSIIFDQRVIIDTLVIPSDSSLLEILFGCDSLNRVYVRSLNERSNTSVKTEWKFRDNTLYYATSRDSLQKIITSLETRIKEYSNTRIVQKPVTLTKNSKFAVFALWWFWISCLTVLAYLAIKFKVWRLFIKVPLI